MAEASSSENISLGFSLNTLDQDLRILKALITAPDQWRITMSGYVLYSVFTMPYFCTCFHCRCSSTLKQTLITTVSYNFFARTQKSHQSEWKQRCRWTSAWELVFRNAWRYKAYCDSHVAVWCAAKGFSSRCWIFVAAFLAERSSVEVVGEKRSKVLKLFVKALKAHFTVTQQTCVLF